MYSKSRVVTFVTLKVRERSDAEISFESERCVHRAKYKW